jgi:hypothetical protein
LRYGLLSDRRLRVVGVARWLNDADWLASTIGSVACSEELCFGVLCNHQAANGQSCYSQQLCGFVEIE